MVRNVFAKFDVNEKTSSQVPVASPKVSDTASPAFCKFSESVMYDTLHHALTIDDLSPGAVTSIIAYAHYLVLLLRKNDGNDAKGRIEPQVFINWVLSGKMPCVHAMIVVGRDFNCEGFDGPSRLKALQALNSAKDGTVETTSSWLNPCLLTILIGSISIAYQSLSANIR